MGRTACTEPQCLYKAALYFTLLLAAFCCDEPLFLVGMSYVIYAHLFFFQECNYGIKQELGVMPFS